MVGDSKEVGGIRRRRSGSRRYTPLLALPVNDNRGLIYLLHPRKVTFNLNINILEYQVNSDRIWY